MSNRSAAVGRRDPSDEAAIDEPSQHAHGVVDRVTAHRGLDHLQRDRRAEHAEPSEHGQLGGPEQLQTPLDGVGHRALPVGGVSTCAAGGAEPLVEAGEQHGRREGPHVRRGQLHRQGEPVDGGADLFDARAMCRQVEGWVEAAGGSFEQDHGRCDGRLLGRHGEGFQREDDLAVDPQRFATGGDDRQLAGRAGQRPKLDCRRRSRARRCRPPAGADDRMRAR